ncbi:hypothetical protein [Mucilaginibacter sp. SP1R1]|uniref:hypothetical protein n=1 Tax=Mucilaginibacter sp. SP1R1 TaxID=2723091 RepID=UPI0016128CE0|nr:hypothetical protein [Mucilaginibacter sp. SP1R1]MBB6151165.1 hypothetical protein [Mucilaginibacter sp. SP1R1]
MLKLLYTLAISSFAVHGTDTPFKELLQGAFELAASRDVDLIPHIGYLGKAEQVDAMLEMMDTDQVWQIIRNSIDQASDDLILDIPQPY